MSGGALVVDADPHPLAIAGDHGPVNVEALIEEVQPPGEPMRVAVSTQPHGRDDDGRVADPNIAVGADSRRIWKTLAELSSVPTFTVRGRVTGTTDCSLVFGRDEQGSPQVRAHTADGGGFELEVPATVTQWYAAIDPGRSSTVVTMTPGTPRDLILDVSPGGDLHVSIVDADTRKPLTARLLVHGIDGTVDPSFGPDYRASGAGPLMDALRGDVSTPLPSGRYRIAATKGFEWSVDAKVIEVSPGRVTDSSSRPGTSCPRPASSGATCTCTRARASTRPSRRRTAFSPWSRRASISPSPPSTTSSATTALRSRHSTCTPSCKPSPASR